MRVFEVRSSDGKVFILSCQAQFPAVLTTNTGTQITEDISLHALVSMPLLSFRSLLYYRSFWMIQLDCSQASLGVSARH